MWTVDTVSLVPLITPVSVLSGLRLLEVKLTLCCWSWLMFVAEWLLPCVCVYSDVYKSSRMHFHCIKRDCTITAYDILATLALVSARLWQIPLRRVPCQDMG